ncbi:lysylphosphatidylglycerol synthase domain-containing protein [Dongia sedimenti]|uniref:Lysylphosphatidylglycerol synthase domain-containing protein n=1 Tax=Dongia sedimenti TaxID=3064282 RepID=A0ABU0YJ01_9PROT|nr:lysylphosphatidylglycerol synthase domain-containing protein [Rhodospirillaceae bacterium R-7]
MRVRVIIGAILGVAACVFIFTRHDWDEVWQAITLLGWGLAVIILWRFASLIVAGAAWRLLFRPGFRPNFGIAVVARWICESVNGLLPVAQVGGELARARLLFHALKREGKPTSGMDAAATVIVDMTLALLAQVLFALPGLWHLWQLNETAIARVVGGVVVSVLPLVLLVAAQHQGAIKGGTALAARFGLARLVADENQAHPLWARLAALYRRTPLAASVTLAHIVAWTLRAGETYIALRMMGQDIGLLDAIMIEGLLSAARTLGFLLPAGLGVQEGALLLLCGWAGVPGHVALALALVKRARELGVCLPGLAAWAVLERPKARRHHQVR